MYNLRFITLLALLNSMSYEFLEHTADVYIEARGTSLEEAFQYAAIGTMDVITDTENVYPEMSVDVLLEAGDMEHLLYLWLEEIIFRMDAEGLLFSEFKVKEITDSGDMLELTGELQGEEFDPSKHEQRQAVKAVTYHRMEVIWEEGEYVLRFVLDV